MPRNDGYTRTGNGVLQSLANKASLIPFVGGFFAAGLGGLDTLIETAQWLFRGKFLSAATVLASGTVGNAINAVSGVFDSIPLGGLVWWGARVGTAGVSGRTIGTHGRAVTENLIGGITGALGVRPTVLSSHPAGIGSIGAGQQMQAPPGYWTNRVSQQAGRDPNQQWAEYVRAQQAAQVGMQRS